MQTFKQRNDNPDLTPNYSYLKKMSFYQMSFLIAISFIAYRLLHFNQNKSILWAMKHQAFLKAVGYKLRGIRTSKKLSQEKLAEMSSLHPTFISNLENGKVNSSILSFYRIAQALNIPLSRLFVIKKSAKNSNIKR
jgi:DNA-binding XRE family transcriptional regulator